MHNTTNKKKKKRSNGCKISLKGTWRVKLQGAGLKTFIPGRGLPPKNYGGHRRTF